MVARTTRTKHSLGPDKMLGEKKVVLDGMEWELNLLEVALADE
jgi:hypothetical protein